MNGYLCTMGRSSGLPPIDPDGMCCGTAAYSGGEDCSCWEEVYDREPTHDVQAGPPAVRRSMCTDCAYRPDSPERREADGDLPDYSLTRPFTCHQGMPVLLGYVVPSWCTDGVWQTGAFSVPARLVHDRDNFSPVTREGRAWKADGQPADLCGGWGALMGVGRR